MMSQQAFLYYRKWISGLMAAVFVISSIGPGYAQGLAELPAPGAMVFPGEPLVPAVLKGVKVDVNDPLAFTFLVDQGDVQVPADRKKAEYEKFIRYFLVALTIPEKDMWVNLSPYESGRLAEVHFGQTAMGRDLLAQDYILKQLAASLFYPEKDLGKEFWARVYARAQQQFGTTDIPLDTYHKVWIVPATADVYEEGATAVILKSSMRVMLESDYLASKNEVASSGQDAAAREMARQAISDIIVPEIEKEVNTGRNFAGLRQIYNAMILSAWFKKKLKDHAIQKMFVNEQKISGLKLMDRTDVEWVYQQYLEAYKKGVFNYIKEENDPATGETMPRRYFSGGFDAAQLADRVLKIVDRSSESATLEARALASGEAGNLEAVEVALGTVAKGPVGIARTRSLLDQVRYIGDKKFLQDAKDPKRRRKAIGELFDSKVFYVQNNRKMDRKARCSGNCWFCYAHRLPLIQRQRQTQPMEVRDAKAIVNKALRMGFKHIQLNGEDTLDDPESFWAMVDAARDKPIGFMFITSGFYLLEHSGNSLAFFQELKTRLGRVKSLSVTFSWDSEKVERLVRTPKFHGDADAVYKAMAEVVHNFRQVFPSRGAVFSAKYSLSIDAHDMGVAGERRSTEALETFHQRISRALKELYGHSEQKNLYIHMEFAPLFFQTPEAVVQAVRRGRIYKQYTVEQLFRAMAKKRRSTCHYAPFFDMSSGEMVTCLRRQEYPRRVVTPANFERMLMKPFSNPRTRHLFFGGPDERSVALVKQLGFALALKPSLGAQMQVSFEEVESHMFSDEELMTRIEMLYLLEDMVNMAGNSMDFHLDSVPQDLAEELLSDEMLKAWLKYYLDYRVEERLSDPLRKIVMQFGSVTPGNISTLRNYLKVHVMAPLARRGVISSGVSPQEETLMPGLKAPAAPLPSLEVLGFKLRDRLQKSLSSDIEKERKPGFNLLALMAEDGYDLREFIDILEPSLDYRRLTESEQKDAVGILMAWANNWKKPLTKNRLAMVMFLVSPFILWSPFNVICSEALKAALDLDDKMQEEEQGPVLSRALLKMLYDRKAGLFALSDTLTKIKLLRQWVRVGLVSLEAASTEIAQWPVPGDLNNVLEEIGKWADQVLPFWNILQGLLVAQGVDEYQKAWAAELLGQNKEGRQLILDHMRRKGVRGLRGYYLDMVEILLKGKETKAVAIGLLNELPLEFFEIKEVFIHINHGVFHESLFPYHKALELKVMARHMNNLSPGSLILNARKAYFKETRRKVPVKPDWERFSNEVENAVSDAFEKMKERNYPGASKYMDDVVAWLKEVDPRETDEFRFPKFHLTRDLAIEILRRLLKKGYADEGKATLLRLLEEEKSGMELRLELKKVLEQVSVEGNGPQARGGSPDGEDAAMTPGGIDLNEKYLRMTIQGNGIDLAIPQSARWLINEPIDGFVPVITAIRSGQSARDLFFKTSPLPGSLKI